MFRVSFCKVGPSHSRTLSVSKGIGRREIEREGERGREERRERGRERESERGRASERARGGEMLLSGLLSPFFCAKVTTSGANLTFS